MKKDIKIICYVFLLSCVFISCSDILDKDPLTAPNSNTFWNNEIEASRALTACYVELKEPINSAGRNQSGLVLYWEALSDNASNTSNWEGFDLVMRGDFGEGTAAGVLTKNWENAFQGVAACNYFLANVDRVPNMLEETRKKMKGEALFLRGFYYNDLAQLYGDVPLILEPASLNSGFQNTPRTPKSEVVAQIVKDLDLAIEYLPQVAYTNGHAVKGSAIGLKTRVLLNNKRYKEAADAAWSLIGDPTNPFSLHNNYLGVFQGPQQTNNKEIMFSIIFKAPEDYHSLDQVLGGRMSIFPTVELRNAYEMKNPETGEYDPRRDMTIFEPGDNWAYSPKGFGKEGSTAEGQISYTNMAWKKYVDTTINNASGATLSEQDIVKLRYADVLLMYAEAMFEDGQGADPRALKALNDVRARPGVEMPAKTELTREIIRNERRVELALEGLRYNDLIRWEIADQVIPAVAHNAAGAKRKFRAYLFPVPLAEMDRMKGQWTQNSGY